MARKSKKKQFKKKKLIQSKTIRKIKDDAYKSILGEPELYCQFIRNFVPLDSLKDIQPEDIEDYTERYLPLTSGNRDADTVKLIKMDRKGLFVITLTEPQTEVKFLMPFRILEYCVFIWRQWIKDKEKEKKGSTTLKSFRLPPILPIVYYSGTGQWTAMVNFMDKVEHADIFGDYIPNFRYEVVSLPAYTVEELKLFEDALSFIMIIDKIKKPTEVKKVLEQIDKEYIERIKANIPEHLWELIHMVVTLFLAKINAPKEDIKLTKQRNT